MNGKAMKAAVVPLMGGDWRVRAIAIPPHLPLYVN